MKPYTIYILDILSRAFYILISFTACGFLTFNFIETLLLFEVFSIIPSLSNKRFILTKLTQLFTTVWFFCINLSMLFIYPLVVYHTTSFLSPSLYIYQSTFRLKLLKLFNTSFFFGYLFTHFFLIPSLVTFLLHWEILDEYSFFRIEAELVLLSYINWVIAFKLLVASLASNVTFFLLLFTHFNKITYLYKATFFNKRVFVFLVASCLLFFIPPDLLTQILLTFLVVALVEVLLFFLCFKLFFKKSIKTNAHVKTNPKKTPQRPEN